jgi:hypothetical protein
MWSGVLAAATGGPLTTWHGGCCGLRFDPGGGATVGMRPVCALSELC